VAVGAVRALVIAEVGSWFTSFAVWDDTHFGAEEDVELCFRAVSLYRGAISVEEPLEKFHKDFYFQMIYTFDG
jgi:hypothetical protein